MQGDRVDQFVHVVEDQAERLRQRLHGFGQLAEELGLGPSTPRPRAVQPARLRDRRTTGDRGHDRRPQPPRVIVIAIHTHPGRVHAGARAGPVREQQRLPVPGRGTDQGHLRARTRVQTRTQLGPSHEPTRKRRHRDLHTRYEHHCDQLQSPVRSRVRRTDRHHRFRSSAFRPVDHRRGVIAGQVVSMHQGSATTRCGIRIRTQQGRRRQVSTRHRMSPSACTNLQSRPASP